MRIGNVALLGLEELGQRCCDFPGLAVVPVVPEGEGDAVPAPLYELGDEGDLIGG